MINFIYYILSKFKGGGDMMALLLAQRIILGKNKFTDVPNSLKEQVYEILVDSGVGNLAGDYNPQP